MTARPMKPETIIRRAAERTAAQAARRESLLARLAEKATPGSIWAEMLAEQVQP